MTNYSNDPETFEDIYEFARTGYEPEGEAENEILTVTDELIETPF